MTAASFSVKRKTAIRPRQQGAVFNPLKSLRICSSSNFVSGVWIPTSSTNRQPAPAIVGPSGLHLPALARSSRLAAVTRLSNQGAGRPVRGKRTARVPDRMARRNRRPGMRMDGIAAAPGTAVSGMPVPPVPSCCRKPADRTRFEPASGSASALPRVHLPATPTRPVRGQMKSRSSASTRSREDMGGVLVAHDRPAPPVTRSATAGGIPTKETGRPHRPRNECLRYSKTQCLVFAYLHNYYMLQIGNASRLISLFVLF